MDSKQKSLLVLTVIALGFLGYQVYELVHRDMIETPTIAQRPQPTVVQPAAKPELQTALSGTQGVVASKQALPMTMSQSNMQAHMDKAQSQYVKMLNQFELVKMQRQLLDEETAIANAQHQIAVMRNKTQELGGTGDYSLGVDSQEGQYQLSYLDEQHHTWSATLEKDKQYQQVSVGTLLPDGYEVTAIDHRGVTLTHGQQRELITFNGIVMLTPIVPKSQIQMVHQALASDHVPTVARAALHVTPVHQANPQGIIKSQLLALEQREQASHTGQQANQAPTIQHHEQTVSEQDATEGADDDAPVTGPVPFGIQLNSFEIKPVVHQVLSVSNFVTPMPKDGQGFSLPVVDTGPDASSATESRDPDFPDQDHMALNARHFLNMPGDKYTIQLIGTYDDAVADRFIAKNKLEDKTLKLKFGHDGHPWVVALYGTYGTFQQAEVKLSSLPHRLRINGAWIRRVSDVQAILRRDA